MVNEQKIKSAFRGVKKDLAALNYELQNKVRYLEFMLSDQGVRLEEIERRISQMERLAIREALN